ncbi:acyltransferase [Ramlibacter sp.]|uniref:acyltransferase family protein n=1 Tax=Ramlibacter sp. TaxID=1917967 RepID=UPI001830C490|nr:acyltransferase [Ramlibacter sp.]MBA2674437.1 acyltransferase [Ramlibacter sp.]
MTTTTNDKTELTNLQVLRAAAALMVVLFHAMGTGRAYGFPVRGLGFLEGWGGHGVDLFFVISGFIMVYIQARAARTPARFLANRVRRIVPLYWVLTLLAVAASVALPARMVNHGPADPGAIAASLAFLSQPLYGAMPVLYLGWSLEFEMLFYVVFAACIALPSLNAAVLAACGMVTAWAVIGNNMLPLEFALGMVAGWLVVNRRIAVPVGGLMLAMGAALLLATLAFKDAPLNSALVYGLPSVLLVAGCSVLRQVSRGVWTRIGDASYSIYLAQFFSVPAFYKLARALGLPADLGDLLVGACAVATAMAGWGVYLAVERPLVLRPRRLAHGG